MKRWLYFFSICILSVQSCSKEGAVSNSSTTIAVKYEIIASSSIISPGSTIVISYTNGSGQLQTSSFSNSSNLRNWSESINVTSNVRPLTLSLSIASSGSANGGYIVISNSGVITQNIYVNGAIKSSNTSTSASTSNSWGFMISPSPINYVVR